MATKFADFLSEIEDEAHAEGPAAVAHLRDLQAHFRLLGRNAGPQAPQPLKPRSRSQKLEPAR